MSRKRGGRQVAGPRRSRMADSAGLNAGFGEQPVARSARGCRSELWSATRNDEPDSRQGP